MKRSFYILLITFSCIFAPPNIFSQQLANSPKDPFFHNLKEIDSAGTKIPFGVILGLGKSMKTEYTAGINESSFPESASYSLDGLDDINFAAYFENFQLEYQKSWLGDRFSFLYRTTGRDSYKGVRIGKMSVNSSFFDLKKEYLKSNDYSLKDISAPSILFFGIKNIQGFDSTFNFATLLEINLGISGSNIVPNTSGGSIGNFYYQLEAGIGFRIPIRIVGIYAIVSYQLSGLEYDLDLVSNEYHGENESRTLSLMQHGIKLSLISSLNFDL